MKTAEDFVFHLFPRFHRRYAIEKRFAYSQYRRVQRLLLVAIRKRGFARVVFILSSLPMWKQEEVYRLLKEGGRFQVHFVICPFGTFDEDQKNLSVGEHRLKNGFSFMDSTETGEDVINTLNPNIIFYPQLYSHLFDYELDAKLFA